MQLASLTSKLEIERSKPYCEGLEQRTRIRYIHIKILLSHATKLHVNVIIIVFVY